MAYGTDGACTRIPTQSDIPGNARVRSYPLRESGAFVWIWMGERGRTHYYWAAAFDIAGVAPDVVDMTRTNVAAAFDEDKALLERLQERTAKDPRAERAHSGARHGAGS